MYFDSAATTMEKPETVMKAMVSAMGNLGSLGRGDGDASLLAAEGVWATREKAARLFHVEDASHVVFTSNATHGLNIAIHALVEKGQKVLVSGYEHNAVTRPLYAIGGISLGVVDTAIFRPDVFLETLEKALSRGVDVMICTYVSNVFGYILPINKVAKLCRKWGTKLIVDASQAAGTQPIDFDAWGAEFVAMPGHKGLYGPQGTGILLCKNSAKPLLFGGTGSESRLTHMPAYLPERLEAGTQNVAGILGLLAGLSFVEERGEKAIASHEHGLKNHCAKGLLEIEGIELFYHPEEQIQSAVLSFRLRGWDVSDLGAYLSRHHVAVRTGLHCAPLAHETVGTLDTGTVRLSFSAFNTIEEVDAFLRLMKTLQTDKNQQ